MKEIKDTVRARVRVAYDGRVFKTFRGTDREARYANEIRVLRHLERAGCNFVPQLLDHDDETLTIVTTNCGHLAEQITDGKANEVFERLEKYGVRHNDPFPRNITYDPRGARFCVIDFELADLLDKDGKPVPTPAPKK